MPVKGSGAIAYKSHEPQVLLQVIFPGPELAV
jgi:hypothetical protein